jgi:peptide chain release factor subunit 3
MGTVVIGKIESGVIRKGENVAVMPNRAICQVIQCWSDDVEVDQVCAGDNIKLKLKGIEESAILPGFVVCSQDSLCHAGRIFDAEVLILELSSIIASGFKCVLHIHAATEDVQVMVSYFSLQLI